MVTKVRGSFNDFAGTGYFDGEDAGQSHLEVTIRATSLDTRNAKRDAHLRSSDFFAVEEYPEMKFVSTTVEPVGDGYHRVTGDLTLKAS